MAKLILNGATSGSISLESPAVSGTTTLTLPTTSGTVVVTSGAQTIEFADGSASTPSITNSGDTNTGIFFPAADTIAFTEGGAEAMRLDSSGNVGIGTTSPGTKLDVFNSSINASYSPNTPSTWLTAQVRNDQTTTSDSAVGIAFVGRSDTQPAGIVGINGNTTGGVVGLGFLTVSGNTTAERMRIDSSGNVLVGKTSQIVDEKFGVDQTAAGVPAIIARAASTASPTYKSVKVTNVNNSTQLHLTFAYNNGANGNGAIAGNGDSQAAFATFSDSRLKKNIEDLSSQLDKINAIRPVEFDYIKSGEHQIGFIAQEVREVYPDLVAEGEDTMLTVVGLGKTEARLIKAIQEQQTIINDLKARIETLEAK
jgi:hypothetical protein